MNGVWRICSIGGIPVLVHWSFGLILLWSAYQGFQLGGWGFVGFSVVLTLLLFACVLLHEFGHALMARRFGIPTRSILLLPVGGVAALVRIPEKPVQELLIAIAGPLVNLLIAGVLVSVFGLPGRLDFELWHIRTFAEALIYVNLAMIAFNLIPAFPMDGGRILRAMLALKYPYVRATAIASVIGQILACGIFIYGLSRSPFMSLIGVMIFFAARKEYEVARIREAAIAVDARETSRPFIDIG